MAAVTIRNLPDEERRALRVRAAMPGRSTEAEIRDILQSPVRPPERLRPGATALSELGRRAGVTKEDFAAFEQVRDRTPAEPMKSE